MQCLLAALRGEVGTRAIDRTEWELAIALADEQRVLPLLAERLLQSGISLPPEIQARLAEAKREALHYSFLQASELKELLRAFAASKIPVIPLKGPSLAQRVYGAAALRISCDLDLLVPQADFAAAALLLQRLSFAPDSVPDDYHQKWSRGETIVELHFDVENPLAIDFDVEGAWRDAQPGEFGGEPAWRLAAQDEFLYLCLHGVRHRFDRMSLIVDIALALRQLVHDNNFDLRLRKRLDHTSRFIVLGCALAQKLYPGGTCHPDLLEEHKGNSGMKQLADRLWNDLLNKTAAQQDWVSMHEFYLETESTQAHRLFRRYRHLRILLTRLIDDDFRFAAQFGLQRRWQVWLLRPARLVLRGSRSLLAAPTR